ncbi:acyl-CoA binding family protein [Hibiscus syriacus]|uniref:Acyl-CoA binding family protein n=1 Tax=Hibiscus syriacus TaxID=106335 RepID=A0A6A2YSX8_HIBSY|nr:uncharacterized protein LOC120157700 [Hibiscus syriacus]XP_039024689.1 uncharacterized protein LOC120157700 [Hibiscus syriacus]KAE8682235.1 acyl-CoA binding family protein [Hibiscus syriacus]
MISVVSEDAEFDKEPDKIEEKASVSTDEDIDSRNEESRLNLGVSNEEGRVSPMEHDFRVSENNISEFRGSYADSVGKVIGGESRVICANDRVDEQAEIANDESYGIGNSEKGIGLDYKSLLSEFGDYVANDRIGGGASKALSYGFEVGDMVWGKVKSHPWWPGHIFNEAFASPSVPHTRREGHVLVAFFGDSSYGWFDPAELVPFDHNFFEKSQQTNSRTFVKAVEEAMDEASRRGGLGLTCKCRNPFNFRPTNVQGYFAVDVPDYEPNGIYSVNQIRNARNSFKPSETLSFLKQLASAPVAYDQQSIEFLRNKATVSSFRKAVFEEYDETYAQAFGAHPPRPSHQAVNAPARTSKEAPRAPLSGPMVIAEALDGGKSSKKPIKVKDHSKKDRYIFKRRDEAASATMQSTYREGSPTFVAGDYVLQKRDPVSQIPVKKEHTVVVSRDSVSSSGDLSGNAIASVNQTSSANAVAEDVKPSLNKIDGGPTSSQHEGDVIFDLKPEGGKLSPFNGVEKHDMDSTAKLEGGQGVDQIQDGLTGGHPLVDIKRSGGMSDEGGLKNVKKRTSGDIGAENSALVEKKKKKKKNEAGSETNSDNHGVERTSPTIVKRFFLRYRSLVYQKSLVVSPPSETDPGEPLSGKPPLVGTSDNYGKENVRHSTPKPARPLAGQDDPTKAGLKRLPSDRQEEIAAKRLKKITKVKSLAAEKKGNLRTSEAPKVEVKEKPTAGPPGRPLKKPDSARKMEPPPRAVGPTMLVMKFPPEVSLPSVAQLKARFGRFGSLDQSAIRVFYKSSTCRVVFRHKIDAQAAYRYVNGTNSLFGNVNVRYHLRSVEAPTAEALDSDKGRGDTTTGETIPVKDYVVERSVSVLAQQPILQPTVQLKSCLKKPTSEEAGQATGSNGGRVAARVKFMLGGEETSRGDQLLVGYRNNFNNNPGFADTAAPSVAMEFNTKNFQKVIPQSLSSFPVNPPISQFEKAPSEVAPRNAHNLNTQTTTPPASTTSMDISQQMLNLLTKCNDVVTNVTSMLGYVPYHPL